MKEKIIAVQKYREMLLADKYRPGYHFAIPGDLGQPGDSNGAFYADGRYHLMYLYKNSETNGYHWGHISSTDLLHWRSHPDALTVYEGDMGCFSGGAFVDDDGTAYLTFWKFAAVDPKKDRSGIAIAFSKPPYDNWERIEPIAVNSTEWGILELEKDGKQIHIGSADPSNIWKMNGKYYLQAGNLCVLNKYGREETSPEEYKGGWTDLFCSEDMKNWKYVHRFYENTLEGCSGYDLPDATEDDMCPSFLPLFDSECNGNKTDKWLQLFIAHNRGCQYLVGTLDEDNEKFIPEYHGRMSWKDIAYFAPEALVDDKNRQIIWAWIHDDYPDDFGRFGWSGVYGFPRNVWWENNQLHMAPVAELDDLQYNKQTFDASNICDGKAIEVKNGESFRIKAVIDMKDKNTAGFSVRVSADGLEHTDIYYDKKLGKLVFDATQSGEHGWKIKEEAPFALQDNEKLYLDIFVDKSVVEVYANKRQAICRRVYPVSAAFGVCFLGDGICESVECFEMSPSNMY